MLGARVRAVRRREKLTQAELARRLGVSASYLNLIENNRRPLTAGLLLKLAQEFRLDLSSFGNQDEARLVADLREVFSDPMFQDSGVTPVEFREMASGVPSIAQAVVQLYGRYREACRSADSLAERLDHQEPTGHMVAASPTEEANDLLQRYGNHFPEIEEAAEALWQEAGLEATDVFGGLIAYLRSRFDIDVQIVPAGRERAMRWYDPQTRVVALSEVLPPRTRRFQLAHQVGLIAYRPRFDSLSIMQEGSSEATRDLLRIVLANYFAAAILMPYEAFLSDAREYRYDFELLAHRYRTSFEQVCHRLTTLQRPGHEGIPLHFIRIDIAGNISKRFSASGIRMPRFSGACPRWNVHAAFLTPGMMRVQLSRMPDGVVYFCVARTVQRATGGYRTPHTVHSIGIGCEVSHAKEMIYSEGIDLENLDAVTPVGVTCRTCEQLDCEQRVAPPMQYPPRFDENVRGVSFYIAAAEEPSPVRRERQRHGARRSPSRVSPAPPKKGAKT